MTHNRRATDQHPAGDNPRETRRTLVFTMLVLLAAVLFVVFRILPESNVERFKSRRGDVLLLRAIEQEEQTLWHEAVARYDEILGNNRYTSRSRYEAALRLARIHVDELNDAASAEAALESAFGFAPDDHERRALAARIEALRGYPMQPAEAAPVSAHSLYNSDREAARLRDDGRAVVAQVGGQTVTVEDLMYAWGQSYGNRAPAPGEFEPFVHHYLDMVLLADEARRLGLDRRGRAALDLRMNRIVGLNKALNADLVQHLPDPGEDRLREYYNEHPDVWSPQPPPPPFESVRDQVLYRFQALQAARTRAELLGKLRSSRPIVLHRGPLESLMTDGPSTATAADSPTSATRGTSDE
jgi:hypothetical protein